MTECIFWDNDGVLVDTEPLYFQATAEVLDDIGIVLERDQFIDISLVQGKSVLDLADARGISPTSKEELKLHRNRRYADLLREGACALDGVEETLQALSGKVRMAIVTSSLNDHFQIIHQRTGLLKYFEFVLTREDYNRSKPHPEPYLTALRKSGLNATQCVVVEDSQRGLEAACRADLHCLMIPGELTRGCNLTSAGRVLDSIREVPGALGC